MIASSLRELPVVVHADVLLAMPQPMQTRDRSLGQLLAGYGANAE